MKKEQPATGTPHPAPSPETEAKRTARRVASPEVESKQTARRALIATGCLMLFVVLALLGYRLVATRALATLVDFAGRPERDTAATLAAWRDAVRGDEFADGDGARTPAGSTARFRLLNGATLRMKPASQVRFLSEGPGGSLRVDVELGQVQIQSGSQHVTIGSPFGDIVLQKNTGILLSRRQEQLHVDVEFGAIQIGDKTVTENQRVALEIGGIVLELPAPPSARPTTAPAPSANPEPEPEPEPELELGDGVPDAELIVDAGASFVVHDPKPPTAIGFVLTGVCSGPAEVRAGKQKTQAQRQANLKLSSGRHAYEVRCLDRPEVVAARGSVRVLRDAGTRKLPAFAPTATISTDGRRYTVMYQHQLPRVTVRWPTAPQAASYSLRLDDRTLHLREPQHTFPALRPGQHVAVFAAATTPRRQSRDTFIEVTYDSQAPAARMATPAAGFAAGKTATIEGQALPGWKVSVAGQRVKLDQRRHFRVQTSGERAVPVAFSHPSRGTHYYIRRPNADL